MIARLLILVARGWQIGPSAILPLARLEQATRDPAARDAIASIRWEAQRTLTAQQSSSRGWT